MDKFRQVLSTHFMIIVLILSTATLPTLASAGNRGYSQEQASDSAAGRMIVDTFLVRPAMLVVTVVGAATWLVSLPFTALGGNIGEAGNTLVVNPAKYTFVRPLGELE